MTYSENDYHRVQQATLKAFREYIDSRYEKIPSFVKRYFTLKGALKLNKKALSSDLIKGPLNVFWALPYTGIRILAVLLRKMRLKKIYAYTAKLPFGLETNVQKEVQWLIYTELLEIPYTEGDRQSKKDILFEYVLSRPEIGDLFAEPLSQIKSKSEDAAFRSKLEHNLREYASSRTAVMDLAGSIITLAAGATLFHKITPGSLATGSAIATTLAHQAAISNFVFGSTLGSLYYSIFPVAVPTGLLIASIGSVMAALSLVTSFIGIVTDPIQAKLGIHQRRLKKFIACVEKELMSSGESKLELKDRYVARVFDLLDMLKTAAAIAVKPS